MCGSLVPPPSFTLKHRQSILTIASAPSVQLSTQWKKSKQHLSVMKIILTWKTPRGWGGSLESFTSGSVDHVLGKSPLQRALCHWTLIAMLSPWKECFVHCLFLRTVYSMDFFHPDPSFYIKLINVSPHTVQ